MKRSRHFVKRDGEQALVKNIARLSAPADGRRFRKAFRAALKHVITAIGVCFCLTATGATNDAFTNDFSTTPSPATKTSRGLYNAGTEKLTEGKLDDAEMLLQSAIAKQDAAVQPRALYNLGYVCFTQGSNELKRSHSPESAVAGEIHATDASDQAIQFAQTALSGNDLRQMVVAYLKGRGAHRNLLAATKAVQRAMQEHGNVLLKWRRALGDFKSAAELNPADTNAVRNAEVVERQIAKLVDSMRRMRRAAMMAGAKSSQLEKLMQQLRGRIPKPMLPPGAPGDDEDLDGLLEAMRGHKEAPSHGGKEYGITLSPDEAEKLLNAIRMGGNQQLPAIEGAKGQPTKRSSLTW